MTFMCRRYIAEDEAAVPRENLHQPRAGVRKLIGSDGVERGAGQDTHEADDVGPLG